MTKVWEWLKKYWKWVVFPIGIISAVLGWFLWWRSRDPVIPVSGTTDEAADQAVEDAAKVGDIYQKDIEALNKLAEELLKNASEEQIKEWEEVKKKPHKEVAKWIDNLS